MAQTGRLILLRLLPALSLRRKIAENGQALALFPEYRGSQRIAQNLAETGKTPGKAAPVQPVSTGKRREEQDKAATLIDDVASFEGLPSRTLMEESLHKIAGMEDLPKHRTPP
jgi:hypothetical protein